MAKFHGDVRPLSHDSRYMGVAFFGRMGAAIAQARRQYDFGLDPVPNKPQSMSRDRYRLLQHLNLL